MSSRDDWEEEFEKIDTEGLGEEEIRKYLLRKLIRELRNKKGRGTELISLYIPAGRPIADVMNVLRQEYATATNIKDRTTRHHVLDALEAIMQRLKYFRQTPPNGLVIFCGYVSRGAPGDEKLECYVIEPPEKLTSYLYRCDSRFYTEILEEMLEDKDVYGLMVIDRSEATFALLKGRRLEIVENITSGVPGKHSAGGQSQRRFQRIIEQLAHEFFKRAGEYMAKIFLNIPNLKGIIIGGPGPTKYTFVQGDYIHYMLKDKILGIVDTGYSGEAGIYELAKKSYKILKDVQYIKEKHLVQQFMYYVVKKSELTAYGIRDVVRALEQGAVALLLISEELEGKALYLKCPKCDYKSTKLVVGTEKPDMRCPKCGAELTTVDEVDAVEYLLKLARQTGAKVELISSETEEGKLLKSTFGGVAAILRYRIFYEYSTY